VLVPVQDVILRHHRAIDRYEEMIPLLRQRILLIRLKKLFYLHDSLTKSESVNLPIEMRVKREVREDTYQAGCK
jgi:hypothetical protein